MIVQAILWGLIGFIFSGFSVIWEKENWSLVKQTTIAFFVYLLPIMVVGYILKWFTFNMLQVIIFISIFIFFIIWILIYLKTKKDVDAFNAKIQKH